MATAAAWQGTGGVGKPLNSSNDVSALKISDAPFRTPVTAGTFTVNGAQVTLATTDTLQGVFDKINTATSGAVTGSYDSTTDTIRFNSASEIVLGSATDTSNFLQASRLTNNGTGTVTSASALGTVQLTNTLAKSNLGTAVTDGGSGAGEFKINGVSIAFSATSDSLQTVLDRINNSAAGVTASFDTISGQFRLTNKVTGDIGIGIQDVTGNFLAATGLGGGALQHGKNLLYKVNGGDTLSSTSNTVSSDSSSIAGLTVTALKEGGSSSITVSSDTAKVKSAITDFISAYNRVQSVIDTQTASTTDSAGKVTAGLLSGDPDAYDISSQLRKFATNTLSGLSGSLKRLDAIGIASNGNDNSIALSNSAALDAALTGNMASIQDLFTNKTEGMAVTFDNFLTKTIGDDGTLVKKQSNLTTQVSTIETQIADMEKLVLANKDRLTAGFVAMETAEAKINQQLAYLKKNFNIS